MTLSVDFRNSVAVQNTVVYSQPIRKCYDFHSDHNTIAVTSDTLFEHNLYTCKYGIELILEKHVFFINFTMHSTHLHRPTIFYAFDFTAKAKPNKE